MSGNKHDHAPKRSTYYVYQFDTETFVVCGPAGEVAIVTAHVNRDIDDARHDAYTIVQLLNQQPCQQP